MVHFRAVIKKFDSHSDKTGWSYIEIPSAVAQQVKPDTKVSFLVKGKIDEVFITGMSLLPMGNGDFIMPLKADLRKKLRKEKGAELLVYLEAEEKPYEANAEFLECLKDSPGAASGFARLNRSHQNYFSKWIESAKTEATKAKRIAQSIEALELNLSYAEMIRKNKEDKLF